MSWALRSSIENSNPYSQQKAGRVVIEHAWKVLTRAKKLKQTIEEEQKTLTGTFEVAVLPTIAPYLIPRFFPQLMKEHPEMDVRITEMKTDEMCRAIRKGNIDAGSIGAGEWFGKR